MYFKMKLVIILSMLLALSGCGDLLGKNAKKKEIGTSQFEVNCELNMDEFSYILEKPITSQIRCLGENLNLFIRIVKSGKPGYLSRIQLEKYLADFRPDVKPEVIKALKSIFRLGHLITGEDVDYISKDTLDKVINFAIVFNDEAALHFGPIFKNESLGSYELHKNHRLRVQGASKTIVSALRTIFNNNRGDRIDKLDIIELLEAFTTEDNRETIDKVKKVLFAKTLLLGGDREVLTHTELQSLILNFDQLALMALDVVRYTYLEFPTPDQKQNSILQLLKRDVNDLYTIMHQGELNNRDTKVLFTVDEAIEAVKLFLDEDDIDIEKFRNLIAEAKKIIMKGNGQEVKGIEVKNLFVHAKSLLQTGTVFHRIWETFLPQLTSPLPVTISFDEYRHTYPEHIQELNQFERIVKKYRFMKGEFMSAYYTREYHRNASAMVEIAFWEYAAKLVFSVYGSENSAAQIGGYTMDRAQMQALLKKFEPELLELDLILPTRSRNTADNISLLGSLFQFQSDKNKVLDINEASEFFVTLFTAMDIADDQMAHFESKNCAIDQFDRVDPSCFKENYWQGLCKNYRSYYPLLFESLGFPAKCEDFVNTAESTRFLDKLALAARTCNNYTDGNKEEIPYGSGDMMTITTALIHAETTIMRWDINNNNYLDPSEVMSAYEIYESALDGFMEDKNPIIKKFKKQIFQYMVKYEEVPNEKDFGSIWKFVKFLLSFNKKAPATRTTIASLLVAIAEQNALGDTSPQFDCKYLRDPENIPADPTTPRMKLIDNRQDYSSILTPYLHLAN